MIIKLTMSDAFANAPITFNVANIFYIYPHPGSPELTTIVSVNGNEIIVKNDYKYVHDLMKGVTEPAFELALEGDEIDE